MKQLLLFLSIVLFCLSCKDEEEMVEPKKMVPFDHPLQKIESNQWTFMPVEGMYCRDGSTTGLPVKLNKKKKLVIYLNGGNACFNEITCPINPANFSEDDMLDLLNRNGETGIFNSKDDRNPVKDWSFIFVPYCTGDVHSGTKEEGFALNVEEPQKFVGYHNFTRVMEYITPYFQNEEIEEILFFGLSAGGFGVYLNTLQLRTFFPEAKITVINDSGPLFADLEAFPTCLQLGFSVIFGLPIPNDFYDCCDGPHNLGNVYEYAAERYADINYGLISSYEDATTRFMLSFGQNGCQGAEDNLIPKDIFRNGLLHLRDEVIKSTGNHWSTYFVEGEVHTLLEKPQYFYEHLVNDMYLYQWLRRTMNGEVIHADESKD